MREHEQYKKGELKAGMEVYVPFYFTYGWQRDYSHPSWKRYVVKTVSPKGNTVTLEDGRKYNAGHCTGYYDDLFKYDDEMANDAKMKKLFKRFVDARMELYKYLGDYRILDDAAGADCESLKKAVTALETAREIFGHKEKDAE